MIIENKEGQKLKFCFRYFIYLKIEFEFEAKRRFKNLGLVDDNE